MFEDRKPDCMSFDSGSTGQSGQPGGPYTYSYSYPSPGEDPGRQPVSYTHLRAHETD